MRVLTVWYKVGEVVNAGTVLQKLPYNGGRNYGKSGEM